MEMSDMNSLRRVLRGMCIYTIKNLDISARCGHRNLLERVDRSILKCYGYTYWEEDEARGSGRSNRRYIKKLKHFPTRGR